MALQLLLLTLITFTVQSRGPSAGALALQQSADHAWSGNLRRGRRDGLCVYRHFGQFTPVIRARTKSTQLFEICRSSAAPRLAAYWAECRCISARDLALSALRPVVFQSIS